MDTDAHVLVAGAGGIGCPATWALAASGVRRVTVLDPDVVERSNLPRQVWFREADLGRSKARLAAARMDAHVFAGGVHARLDDRNAASLLEDVDVIVDATDGAQVKDWINQLAVRRGVPLVHAAGLRSEARLMRVAASGRPCLACLFGRLEEETGSCADLGVWNGVVGTVGFLAAHRALSGRDGTGYAVLDFETGRALDLAAGAAADCPVCGTPAEVEPYPADAACAVPTAGGGATLPEASAQLDLREEQCPLNLLRARRRLSEMPAGEVLAIALGAEGAATVPDGVRALGHRVLAEEPRGEGLDLLVASAGARDDSSLSGEDLQRFARQVVLPEVGEAGQRRLGAARVRLLGSGHAWRSARTYLRAAGVGYVAAEGEADLVAWAGGTEPLADVRADVALVEDGDGVRATSESSDALLGAHDAPPAVALAWGTLLADLVQRRIVLGDAAPTRTFAIDGDGDVR